MLGIPNLEQTLSNFLESGQGITAIRSVEWGKKYLWVVDFEDPKPPAPFNAFFPANDITVPFSLLESKLLELPNDGLPFPIRANQRDIRISFYDDQQGTLLKWFSDWQKLDLLNLGQFTSGLGDSHETVAPDSFGKVRSVQPLRQIRFGMLDATKDEVLVKNFWVYPDGEILFSGNQASEAQVFQVTFKIVKDGLNGKLETNTIFSAKGLKSILGRFI